MNDGTLLEFGEGERIPSALLARLQAMAAAQRELEKPRDLDRKWDKLTDDQLAKMYDSDGRLKLEALVNFRRRGIFVSDQGPYTDYADWEPRFWRTRLSRDPAGGTIAWMKERLDGSNRGCRRMLADSLARLEGAGGLPMLRRHPADRTPGNPYVVHKDGSVFNLRWLRHIYFNTLLDRHLGAEIRKRERFAVMDIGCSYSIFASILKKEHPNTTFVLVDFPDQLLLSAYFLGAQFPQARVLAFPELADIKAIDRAMAEAHDFILVPVNSFDRIRPGTVDLVTNFFSFGEMPRRWFNYYVQSDVFRQAEWFLTCNRFESAPAYDPTYDTDLTILDYPLADFEPLHFSIFPIYPFATTRKNLFWYEITPLSSQYFDFIGRRRAKP